MIIKLFLPRTKMLVSGCAIVFLTTSLIIGPGLLVNVALKNHWARPRPGHTVQFGGHQHFVAWWDPRGECQKNCSFVSGEASSAFWTIAPAALAPTAAWRALAYSAAIAFGVVISALRMMVGAHFLSDTIFAGVFTFLIIWLMYALVYRWQRTRLDDKTVEDALVRLSTYCRTTMSTLLHRSQALFIAIACVCFSACAQSPRLSSSSDLNSNQDYPEMTKGAQHAAEQEQKEWCAKISELAIGMTPSQVQSSSCEQAPLRTQEVITRQRKHLIIWTYKSGYLEFEDGKLARIRPIQ